MKKKKQWMLAVLVLLAVVVAPMAATRMVMAESNVETTVLPDSWASKDGVGEIFKFILNFVVYGLGAAAVLGTLIAGIMYLTARDNEAQVAAAKKRLLNVAIGLAAWAVMFTAMNWLIPGGILLGSSGGDGGGNIQPPQNGGSGGQGQTPGGDTNTPNGPSGGQDLGGTDSPVANDRENGSEVDIPNAEVGPTDDGYPNDFKFEGATPLV